MPTPTRELLRPVARAMAALLLAIAYAAAVHAACSCYGCLSGQSCSGSVGAHVLWQIDPLDPRAALTAEFAEPTVPSAEFRIGDRWLRTATNGTSARRRGDPLTLTWGIVDDGVTISGSEGTSGSDLIAMLNTEYGSGPGGIESAPWFRLFEDAFGRWSELSGVTYEYEPKDGGAAINGTTTPRGVQGVYPDVRIGGHSIDGASGSNTLAYNYFPDHSDMVIDTDNASYYGNAFLDSRRLRNVLMHEAGHGLGFNHVESSNSGQLMEPSISTAFDGPQIDDILAVQRNYGDALEKDGGNDLATTATDIGELGVDDRWLIGADARSFIVSRTQTDFVSIDGATDRDYFRFTVSEPTLAVARLEQLGRTYREGPQDGEQQTFITSDLNDLRLALQESRGSGVLTVAEGLPQPNALGEVIFDVELLPGHDYFLRVAGTSDNVQLYELELELLAIPEPTAVALVGGLAGLAAKRRMG